MFENVGSKKIIFIILGVILLIIGAFIYFQKSEKPTETAPSSSTVKKIPEKTTGSDLAVNSGTSACLPSELAKSCETSGSICCGGGAGSSGASGRNGTDGADGISGTNGSDGTNGTNGSNGIDGQDGADGATGPQGPAGPAGPQGPAGPSGDTGGTGDGGDDGGQGAYGDGPSPQNDSFFVDAFVYQEVSISCGADVIMTPSIPGVTGGLASSVSSPISCTVITNNNEGWELSVKHDHKLRKGLGGANKEFADYTTTQPGTNDYNWQAPSAGNAEFGFSVSSGTKAVNAFKNNGSSTCNYASGTPSLDHCWVNLANDDMKIAEDTVNTGPIGNTTSMVFKAQSVSGAGFYLEEGAYTATIFATVVTK